MRIKSAFDSSFKLTQLGKRPTNSGIIPNFTRSSGVVMSKSVSMLASTRALNPILVPCTRFFTMLSSPTKAPPAMNKMFLVSISIISPPGCLRPPPALTRHTVPSTIFSRACCTPSPLTSLVIEVDSPLRLILSISSTNTMPCCVLAISLPDAAYSLLIRLSTSSPT